MVSRDEVIEWAENIAKDFKIHPLRPIGMLDTYAAICNSYEDAMQIIENKLRSETHAKKEQKLSLRKES